MREANLAGRTIQVRGAYLGQRHLLRVTGKDETADAKALVQSLHLPDGSWKTPLITSPDGASVGIHLYLDRPQAERARRGEAMRVLRIIQPEGIPDAMAQGRDGMVARGWTHLAKVDYDVASATTRTTLNAEAVRAADADPGIIQRRINDTEDRPRPEEHREGDSQATPGVCRTPPLRRAQRLTRSSRHRCPLSRPLRNRTQTWATHRWHNRSHDPALPLLRWRVPRRLTCVRSKDVWDFLNNDMAHDNENGSRCECRRKTYREDGRPGAAHPRGAPISSPDGSYNFGSDQHRFAHCVLDGATNMCGDTGYNQIEVNYRIGEASNPGPSDDEIPATQPRGEGWYRLQTPREEAESPASRRSFSTMQPMTSASQGSPSVPTKRRRTEEMRSEHDVLTEVEQQPNSDDELEHLDALQWDHRSHDGSSFSEDHQDRDMRDFDIKHALHAWEIDRAVAYYTQKGDDAGYDSFDSEELGYLDYLRSGEASASTNVTWQAGLLGVHVGELHSSHAAAR